MTDKAPAWLRALAHLHVLMKLWSEKIVANMLMIAALIGIVAYLRGGSIGFMDGLAVAVAYSAAFMVNFFVQFARYRAAHPCLASDRAAAFGELTAALGQDYHDMMKSTDTHWNR